MNITLTFDKKLSLKELQAIHKKMEIIDAVWYRLELEHRKTEIVYKRMSAYIENPDFFTQILCDNYRYNVDYN